VAGTFATVREFVDGLMVHRRSLPAHDAWLRASAAERGLAINPHRLVRARRLIWLAESDKLFGHRFCPSFEPTGDAGTDTAITCPCSYLEADLQSRGVCHCGLLGLADSTSAEFREAEKRHTRMYAEAPMQWTGKTLDTRGSAVDNRRKLPAPGAIHQVRRALAARGLPLSAIVGEQVEAEHVGRLAQLRGFTCVHDARAEGGVLVRMGEA